MFRHVRRCWHARMQLWLIVSLALLAAIALTAPQLLPVSLYKLSLITMAAWVAYWIDRGLFPYARPDSFLDEPFALGGPCCEKGLPAELAAAIGLASAMLRRALIIAAAMLAVALGA